MMSSGTLTMYTNQMHTPNVSKNNRKCRVLEHPLLVKTKNMPKNASYRSCHDGGNLPDLSFRARRHQIVWDSRQHVDTMQESNSELLALVY